jgi:HK97 family phage major capsid protein
METYRDMTTPIEREFEAYRRDDLEARSILDTAAAENRATTAEEDERFDKLVESASAHKQRADKLVRMDADAAAVADGLRSITPADDRSGEPARDGSDADLMGIIRLAHSGLRAGQTAGEFGVRNLDLPVDEAEVVRVITDFGHGSYLYVSDFATNVAVYQRTMSPWARISSIITANNGRPLNLPFSSADPTSYTPGEGTAITASDPTLGTAIATPVSYKHLGYVSAEAEEDEVMGLMGVIARQAGRSVGLAAGAAFTTSILALAANGGTATGIGGTGTAAGTFLGADDWLTLKYGRAEGYRLVGSYVAANSAIQKAKKWKDANGQYLLQPAIGAGSPDTFDGNPVYEDPGLAAVASATKSVLFGDASAVVIKQMPLRVAVSTEFAFNLDNVAIKTVLRAGATLPDAAAIAYIVSKDT